MKEMYEGITFDDVLLEPAYSEILPHEVDIRTKVTRNLELNIPILSAAMDTVTEARMAIAIAQNGGLGIIHRNLTIEEQVNEVKKVKRFESGIIRNPITIHPNAPLYKAREIMETNNISGIPVVENSILVGLITSRDLQFETKLHKPVQEVMTPREKLITAKEGISLKSAKKLIHTHRIEKLPIIDDEGHLKGLITVKDLINAIQYPHATKDEYGRLRVGAAIGVVDAPERADALISAELDLLVIDTAHAHSSRVIETLKYLKKQYLDVDILVGNIATREAAELLIENGADGLKVGVGPGSICTTRVVSGVGVPQITALLQVASVAMEHGIPVTADGGIRYSGDITKALASGADVVMIGSLLAGTDESPGELILYQGRTYKTYRGMGSLGALAKGRSRDRYSLDQIETAKLVPEGVEGRVPYRGPVAQVLEQLVGGLRAGMGYCGTRNIHELKTKTRFIRITWAGYRESHVHDVAITKEAPNYRVE